MLKHRVSVTPPGIWRTDGVHFPPPDIPPDVFEDADEDADEDFGSP